MVYMRYIVCSAYPSIANIVRQYETTCAYLHADFFQQQLEEPSSGPACWLAGTYTKLISTFHNLPASTLQKPGVAEPCHNACVDANTTIQVTASNNHVLLYCMQHRHGGHVH